MDELDSNTLWRSSEKWVTYDQLSRPVRVVNDVHLFAHYLENSNNVEEFQQLLFQLDVSEIEKFTRGQSNNSHWFSSRAHVLTGSTIYRLITALRKENFDITKYFYKIEKKNISPLYYPSIKWGQKSEKLAIAKYITIEGNLHKDFEVLFKGLVHSQTSPFLAMSPDGVHSCKCHGGILLEVKSPYSIRDSNVHESKLRYLNSDLTLKKNSQEYFQIQAGMYCLELKLAKLLIFTKSDLFIIDVKPDYDVWYIFKYELPTFYFEQYVKHYYSQRY